MENDKSYLGPKDKAIIDARAKDDARVLKEEIRSMRQRAAKRRLGERIQNKTKFRRLLSNFRIKK